MKTTDINALSAEGAFLIHHPTTTPTAPVMPFDKLVAATLKTVAESSGRIYDQTYRLWLDWCQTHEADPLALTFALLKSPTEMNHI